MRRLTDIEERARAALANNGGSYCPGTDTGGLLMMSLKAALKGLVQKKRAYIENTDDGPRYILIDGDGDAA